MIVLATRLRRRLRDERGFTLVELTTTMAVLGIFFAAAAMVLSTAIRDSSQVEDHAATQGEVRAAVDALTAELRSAYSDPTVPYSIQTATGTTLTFYAPDRSYNANDPAKMRLRKVSYRLSGGELQRATSPASDAFAPQNDPAAATAWTWSAGSALGAYNKQVGTVTNSTLFTYWQRCATPGSAATVDHGVCGTDYLAQLFTISIQNIDVVRTTVTVSPRGSQGRTYTYSNATSLRTEDTPAALP